MSAFDVDHNTENPRRYFLDCDDSAHYYLVPLEHYADWKKWTDFIQTDSGKWTEEEEAYAWEPPSYAHRIDSWSSITFTDPRG